MNPPLAEIVKGIARYRQFYGTLLRQKQPPGDKRVIRKKHNRFKKALALLKPMLG